MSKDKVTLEKKNTKISVQKFVNLKPSLTRTPFPCDRFIFTFPIKKENELAFVLCKILGWYKFSTERIKEAVSTTLVLSAHGEGVSGRPRAV